MRNARKLAAASVVILGSVLLAGCSGPSPSGGLAQSIGSSSAPPSDASGQLLDEAAAVNAARQCGLRDGVSGWTAELREHPELGFIWNVRSTLYETRDERGGQLLVIDARTGALADSLGWAEMWVTDDPGPLQVVPLEPAEAPN